MNQIPFINRGKQIVFQYHTAQENDQTLQNYKEEFCHESQVERRSKMCDVRKYIYSLWMQEQTPEILETLLNAQMTKLDLQQWDRQESRKDPLVRSLNHILQVPFKWLKGAASNYIGQNSVKKDNCNPSIKQQHIQSETNSSKTQSSLFGNVGGKKLN